MPKTALHAVQSPGAQVPDTSEVVFNVIRSARDTFDESMKAAFDYGGGREPEDTQKALYAIAYLMEWATGAGNEQASPMAFNGLSHLVHKCARDVGRLYTQDDVRAFGGSLLAKQEKKATAKS